MDMFMDKLAEKLKAQEIIDANRAADTQEFNRLQEQLKEYGKCLEEMQQLNQSIRTSMEEMDQKLQEKGMMLERMIQNASENSSRKLDEHITQLSAIAARRIDETGLSRAQIDRLIEESLDKIREIQQASEAPELDRFLAASNDFVHKENVKVYRNVQAVVVEETTKQNESLKQISESLQELKDQEVSGKSFGGILKGILGVSIAAMILSAGSVVLWLLTYFHII